MAKRGPSYPVTPEWKQKVIKRLDALGMTRSDLAGKIGSSRTAITDLLGRLESSALVRKVEGVLWPHAKIEELDPANAQVQRLWSRFANKPYIRLSVYSPVEDPDDPGDPQAHPGHHLKLVTDQPLKPDDNEIAAFSSLMILLETWVGADDDHREKLVSYAVNLAKAAKVKR
jgi:hypothetical protein